MQWSRNTDRGIPQPPAVLLSDPDDDNILVLSLESLLGRERRLQAAVLLPQRPQPEPGETPIMGEGAIARWLALYDRARDLRAALRPGTVLESVRCSGRFARCSCMNTSSPPRLGGRRGPACGSAIGPRGCRLSWSECSGHSAAAPAANHWHCIHGLSIEGRGALDAVRSHKRQVEERDTVQVRKKGIG